MDYPKTLKLRFRIGDLGLPERRRYVYVPPVVGRRRKMHRCALVAKQQSRTHIMGECEMYKEELDVLEEDMEKIHVCV